MFRYFTLDEFTCSCCGKNEIREIFVEVLDIAREFAGIPFKINSGYRCKRHNDLINGAPNSEHIHGLAADISVIDSHTRYVIITALLKAGITRIGVAKTFIHAGLGSDGHPEEVVWVY